MARESEDDQRRPGRSKWKRRQIREDWFKEEDALRRDKWRDGVRAIAERMGVNPAISAKGTTPEKN